MSRDPPEGDEGIARRGQLAGRVALVTGAGRGIGRAIAAALHAEGALLEVSDVDAAAASAAADELAAAGGDAHASVVDVARPEEVRAWIDDVVARRSRVDVLVNNAGVQLNRAALELSDDDWTRVLSIDLDGAFTCSREAGRYMVRQGRGAIVNISSIAERFGMPRRLPYGVSKAGIAALTRGLAAEWAPDGVRVNAIAPGYIETELVRHALAAGHIDALEILAKIPLGRMGRPSDVAEAALFLASDRSAYVTGHTLFVDGGYAVSK
jgi:NAD(P)-dependent dehydrogenase (short-subunit alcohol dehydrogenase family)